MAKIRKILTAGALTIETVYPAPRPRDSYAARQGRKNVATEAQRLLNLKYAYQKLELQLAANIRPGDWKIVLTYQPERLPPSRKAAHRDLSHFLRKMRRSRSDDWCYFYRMEHKHKAGTNYHFHLYISSGAETPEDIEKMWGQGHVYLDPIKINGDNTYEQLARYMVKEAPDKLGQHLWGHSQHLRQPECDRIRVPENFELTPPAGAAVLFDTGRTSSIYGSSRTIKYMAL